MKQRLLVLKDGVGNEYQFTYSCRIPTPAFVGYMKSLLKKVVVVPEPIEVTKNEVIDVSTI